VAPVSRLLRRQPGDPPGGDQRGEQCAQDGHADTDADRDEAEPVGHPRADLLGFDQEAEQQPAEAEAGRDRDERDHRGLDHDHPADLGRCRADATQQRHLPVALPDGEGQRRAHRRTWRGSRRCGAAACATRG
jgi:hypothetical protein